VRRKPYSIVLLDEIEKAHADILNILLQVLDDGRLTDNKGRLVNFKNTIIIMTSNLGSGLIHDRFEGIKATDFEAIAKKTRFEVVEVLKQNLRPEFLNRIDETILFLPLSEMQIKEIVKIQLNNLKSQLIEKGIKLVIKDEALDWISESGYDPYYGARPVKRIIQKEVLNELSKTILSGKIDSNHNVVMDIFDGKIVFRKPVFESEEL